jgi:undecaprenyl-diphosphatase
LVLFYFGQYSFLRFKKLIRAPLYGNLAISFLEKQNLVDAVGEKFNNKEFRMKKVQYVFASFAFILFLFIFTSVYQNGTVRGDSTFFPLFENMMFLKPFSIIGTELVIGTISILLMFYLWLRKKDYLGVLTVVVAVAGSNVINKLLKSTVERERPPFSHGEDGFSFPSGHAMVGLVFLLLLVYFISKEVQSTKIKLIFYSGGVLLALFTGMSRVVEKAHYFSDVLAGFLLGYAYFTLCIVLYETSSKVLKKKNIIRPMESTKNV